MSTPDSPFPPPEPGLDAAVRAHLDAEAARTDAPAVWGNVLARLNADPPTTPAKPTRRRWVRAALGVAATAAAVVVALFFWPAPRQVTASPSDVIREARTAHAAGPDRCYSFALDFPQPLKDRFPLLADNGRTQTVWTSGDQFVVSPGFTGKGAWGRDHLGRVWFAPTREAAARFTVDELPTPLKEAVAVRGLALDTLLGELLADYDLAWAEGASPTDADRITATPRGPVGLLGMLSADISVDPPTHVVRELILRRKLPNDAVVTLRFRQTEPGGDAQGYPAERHLNPKAPVYDADAPILRRRVLIQGLGEIVMNGL